MEVFLSLHYHLCCYLYVVIIIMLYKCSLSALDLGARNTFPTPWSGVIVLRIVTSVFNSRDYWLFIHVLKYTVYAICSPRFNNIFLDYICASLVNIVCGRRFKKPLKTIAFPLCITVQINRNNVIKRGHVLAERS